MDILGEDYDGNKKNLKLEKKFKFTPNNTDNILKNTAIVLQGYATSKKQMLDIFKKYTTMGFTNIVISSYSSFIPDELLNKSFVITNDDILGKYDRVNKKNSTGLNYQILTTQRGIKYIVNSLNNVDYIVKLRADQFCHNLNLLVEDWITAFNTLKPIQNHPFQKKIVTPGISGKYKPCWSILDYISFGTTKDMYNLWNIPTTQRDNTRAEDYINTFYIIKYLSKKTESEVENMMCNQKITQYSNSPKDYFIFDNRFCKKYLLYSYKPVPELNSPGFKNNNQACNTQVGGVWGEMHYNFL